MKTLLSLFILTSLPMFSTALDFEKFALTVDLNRNWNTSGLKDAYRLYSFRKDVHGDGRELQYVNTFAISHLCITEGDLFIQTGLSFGAYHFNEKRMMGLGGSLLITKYVFCLAHCYTSISSFQVLGKEQNLFLKSANLGLLFHVAENRRGRHLQGSQMGVGFSLLHVQGSFIPGINLKSNSWRM